MLPARRRRRSGLRRERVGHRERARPSHQSMRQSEPTRRLATITGLGTLLKTRQSMSSRVCRTSSDDTALRRALHLRRHDPRRPARSRLHLSRDCDHRGRAARFDRITTARYLALRADGLRRARRPLRATLVVLAHRHRAARSPQCHRARASDAAARPRALLGPKTKQQVPKRTTRRSGAL